MNRAISSAVSTAAPPRARTLRVLVVGGRQSPLAERCVALLDRSGRATPTRCDPRLRSARRAARAIVPDVIIVVGREAAAAAWLLKASGWRVVALWDDGPIGSRRLLDAVAPATALDRPARLLVLAAKAAGRPGAGLADRPAVSVVATVLDEAAKIDELVDEVLGHLGPDDEFVVVDGGSADDTVTRLRRRTDADPRITVLQAPGTNISEGRNAAIRAARHDVIATTDAGCHPSEGWLDALSVAFAEEEPPGLAAGTAAVAAHGPFQRAQSLACYPDPTETRRPDLVTRIYGTVFGTVFDPTLPFARSLAFTREAWETAGGFPEDLGWTEDGVFGRNVARSHECVLASDALVTWEQHLSVKATARMYHRYGRGAAASGDSQLVLRDVVRASAYCATALLLALRRRGANTAVALGAAAYFSVPLRRAARNRAGVRAAACIPAAMAVKDLAKVAGAASTRLGRARAGASSRPTRRRVLFVVPDMRVGGAERHAALVLRALPPDRYERLLCCLGGGGPMAAVLGDDGVAVRHLGARGKAGLVAGLVRLALHMRQTRPDIVMTFGLAPDVLGRIAARLAGVETVVCWKHNIGHLGRHGQKERLAEALTGTFVDRYFAVSQAQVRYLSDVLRLDARKIRTIPNAVDPDDYEPLRAPDAHVRRELGIEPGQPVILAVAALRREKDHRTLLRAFVTVRDQLDDVRLVLAGDGPERQALEQLAKELNISEHVLFLGDRDDVGDLLHACDVVALSSFTIENAPYSVLEAMACARPVVSTAVGGLAELIEDGVTGRLVQPRQPDDLARALIDVLDRPDRAREMGRAARHRLEQRFDIRGTVDRLEHELSGLAAA